MLALIVAEISPAIDKLSSVLGEAGHDVLIRRWFPGVLEDTGNHEAGLVIINAEDYPSKWEKIYRYIKSEFAWKADILMYIPEAFSREETEKASSLGIKSCFSDSDGFETMRKFLGTLTAKKPHEPSWKSEEISEDEDDAEEGFFGLFSEDLFFSETESTESVEIASDSDDFEPSSEEITTTRSEPVSKSETFQSVSEEGAFEDKIFVDDAANYDDEDDEAPDISWEAKPEETNRPQSGEEIMSLTENQPSEGKPQTISCSFVFTNPITLAMVSGLSRNFDGETLEFTPDIASFIMNLDKGTRIDNATIKANEKIESVRAIVLSNDEEKIIFKIIKK